MKFTTKLFFIVASATGAMGCGYQSNAIKQEAIHSDAEVVSFKAEKQAEIDKLNKTYQDLSERLFDQLTVLSNEQLDLERDLNSQALADQAIVNPNKVFLPSLMHDSGVAFINQQFQRIDQVSQQITDAGNQYASSAKTLQASMDQLTRIDTALKKLIASNPKPDAQAILQYIQSGYDGIKSGIAAGKTASTSAPKAPAVTP